MPGARCEYFKDETMNNSRGWKSVVFVLVFWVMGRAGFGQGTTPPTIETLTILPTNDLHAHLLTEEGRVCGGVGDDVAGTPGPGHSDGYNPGENAEKF
jgi:hypothetical protein